MVNSVATTLFSTSFFDLSLFGHRESTSSRNTMEGALKEQHV
jgi:hypothetical protein